MKQTEIGLIPDDWEVKRLGELFEMRAGGDVNKQHFSYYKSDKYKYKIFSNGLENEGVYGFTDLPRYKGDSITITGRGTVGVSMYRKDDFDAVIRLLVLESRNKNQADNFFISELINEVVKFPNESTGVPQLTVPQIKDVLIPLPPLPEQQRIAKALSDVDALIFTTEKLLQKKKNIKQGTMQNLLTGKKRLPGFAKSNNTKMTELGEIPEDWEVKKLGEFTRIQAGGTPSTLFEEYWNGNIRWMNSGELNMKRVYEVEGRITELGLANSSTHLFPKNCVLIGLAGQGKTRGTAAINYVELCTNQSIAAIFPSFSHNSEFLYQNIDNRYNELRELSDGGGGRGGLNLKIIGNLEIALPPKEEQNSIAKILSDMDNEIDLLNTKLEKYRNLKTAMMQQLLTGKIRL